MSVTISDIWRRPSMRSSALWRWARGPLKVASAARLERRVLKSFA